MSTATLTPPAPTRKRTPMWRTVLTPLASLRLTVFLLAASMLIVFTGTSAQKELSLYEVLDRFFYSWGVWVPVKYLLPLSSWGWENLRGSFPFFGGYTLISLLLLNLLAAHTLRFKFNWKRSGILLIHFSLILLLVGELLTSVLKQEDRLTFHEGDTRQWVEDILDYELAVVDSSGAETDRVVAVPAERLSTGSVVKHAQLPFEAKVERWYPNSFPVGPQQNEPTAERLATAGTLQGVGIVPQPKITGVEGGAVDAPSAFITLSAGGKSLGTYLFSVFHHPQEVTVDGKTYKVALRFARTYLPYSLTLIDFTHDTYASTNTARNFASRVRLVDPAEGVDREVVIRMNEPLRYAGRTFYQSSFNPNDPHETTLQVVDNPVWLMPYAACILGAIGLLVHFGMHLIGFLRKRAKSGQLVGFSSAVPPPLPVSTDNGARRKKRSRERDDDARTYTLAPKHGPMAVVFPVLIVVLGLLYVLSHALRAPRPAAGEFDVYTMGKAPVLFEGRVMPLDTVARSALKVISGRQSIKTEEGRIPAIRWLADVMAGTPQGDEYRVFRIDHPQIKDLLGLGGDDYVARPGETAKERAARVKPGDKLFSFSQILLENPKNPAALQAQVDAAKAQPDKRRDLYQRKILDLYQQLALQLKLAQVGSLLTLNDLWADPQRSEELLRTAQELSQTDPAKLTSEQRALVIQFGRVRQQIDRLRMLQQQADAKTEDLYFVPPPSADGTDAEWRGLGQTLIASVDQNSEETITLPPEMAAFFDVMRAFRAGDVASFNREVSDYKVRLEHRVPKAADNAAYEAFFNRFDPFTISIVFYIFAFVLVAGSWLGWTTPLWRGALAIIALAFVVHTLGLVMRLQISGRPPVTSLYSSAVFIAWGVVVLAMGLELVFRNGLGIATSAVVGFLSLLVADGLGNLEGDTMKPLQAVLDTNFWLATHVVCITLGYAAVFLAGALAIAYIIAGVFTKALENEELRKNLVRMTYGILCFAMLFSFVGTILGGIWADQSWGRFWGWDPKENGAVLIVLWVALILHARWSGIARERGVMVLTILGNIVTSWSWFGTNMMGVGLHSYGFMESGVFWLSLFIASQLFLAGIGMLPLSIWRSASLAPPPKATAGRSAFPVTRS